MHRFRNISRIMDCVTCDKCRVWGKLQILGIGTAIKILLHPVEKIVTPTATVAKNDANTAHTASCDVLDTARSSRIHLNRQEIIALLNTLHQFSNSLLFAAQAAKEAQRVDLPQEQVSFASVGGGAIAVPVPVAPHASLAGEKWTGTGEHEPSPSLVEPAACSENFKWKAYAFIGMGYAAPVVLLIAVCLTAKAKRDREKLVEKFAESS